MNTILEYEAIHTMKTTDGESLETISMNKPVMLFFLRHFGCQFCREGLDNLSKMRSAIERSGIELMMVHMAEPAVAENYFKQFNLEGVKHISDLESQYYSAFGLIKGSFNQLFGLHSWVRGFNAQRKYGAEIGKHLGDNFQMPGIFNICEGRVVHRYFYQTASSRPDFDLLLQKCCSLD